MSLSKPLTRRIWRAVRRRWTATLSWRDLASGWGPVADVGVLPGDPLARLGVPADAASDSHRWVEFLGKTRYLNGAKAVVTHSIDDTTEFLPRCLDAIDGHDIKATLFVVTRAEPLISHLWPRLRQAVGNGHEIGSHSRRHPCRVPESFLFCISHMTQDEIEGSRDDIRGNTDQPYVWSFAYPCGNCSDRPFVQRKIARAGYITARAYPDELHDGHALPDLQDYDPNPYAARYTQVVQNGYPKRVVAGRVVAVAGRTDVPTLNGKFDEVSASGGIYSFVSHPQMLDYGRECFYEQHLEYIGRRPDIWYVPMGPLYAYRVLREQTAVRQIASPGGRISFAVFNPLDAKVFNGSVTLEFRAHTPVNVFAGARPLAEGGAGPVTSWRGEYMRRAGQNLLITVQPNTVVTFRRCEKGN